MTEEEASGKVRRAIEALEHERDEMFRAVFENNAAAIAIINPDTTIALVNDAYCAIGGYTKEEIIGLSWTTQIPPGDLERLLEYNRLRLSNPAAAPDKYEFRFYHKSGAICHGLMSVRMLPETHMIITAFTDITDRKLAEAELARANERIIAINRELTRSLADLHKRNEDLETFGRAIAHDLRSMLNIVLGFAEVLEDRLPPDAPEVQRRSIRGITTAGTRMMETLQALLLLSQVQGSGVPREPLDMAAIVARVIDDLGPQIAAAGAALRMPDSWPTVLGHAPWVDVVWRNYISNACKFGGERPRIELSAEPNGYGMVRFRVRDFGIGVRPEDHAKLFHAFTRLGSSSTDGHGLGLSIVHRIVEKLGGQVSVESRGIPGEGAGFCFTLPAA
jgi:PAS domain S-box-containing protein